MERLGKSGILGAIGGVLGVIGVFMPWFSFSFMGQSLSSTGIGMLRVLENSQMMVEGPAVMLAYLGLLALIFSAVAIVSAVVLKEKKKAFGLIGSGALVVLFPVIFIVALQMAATTLAQQSGGMLALSAMDFVGTGVYLTIVAGIVALVGGIMALKE